MASPPPTRVRLGRVTALAGALVLTATVAVVSFVLPETDAAATQTRTGAAVAEAVLPTVAAVTEAPAPAPAPVAETAPKEAAPVKTDPAPPANSGTGRRIVFDQSDQRVWLIEADETVDRTYLVSGSRFDNLKTGTYAVQSRQRHATSFDYTGSMEYFVRFATGFSEPIGFHAIPVYNNGKPEQTVEQLGQPLSAGCIRQKKSDAKYLWDWAPDGTTVVVTA
ncbi:L,D-transpeptidase [Aeromicrobium duanguangcaii]|uniref:L,D-transpeptidase n=1 Tax=Aeromicrobium duanguangcaii TaxID=2968086 RepID=A0ABY5KFM4_9ACTN|nr:L,D-transpeptidase [Aeromicrobium duanguangcaii]MCD9154731.1 L,D-transpeptidase [Aeromicrobium duanguangcaii]MCL3838853.1 L,D-transpeptidase [Aeromicrobium duanguangcaii]UUI67855.1 L,D-transpeptidase [Aeromicrobium duanguangcaii]